MISTMTTKQYNFVKNARIVGITLCIVSLVLIAFAVFQDKQITATNLITLAALIVGFISIVLNKPTPPEYPPTI
jgi:accessory gene regulator protein AgrB